MSAGKAVQMKRNGAHRAPLQPILSYLPSIGGEYEHLSLGREMSLSLDFHLPLVNYHLPFFIEASQWKMNNQK